MTALIFAVALGIVVCSASPVQLLLDGAAATVGDYPFHDASGYRTLTVSNGILSVTFGAVQNTLVSAYCACYEESFAMSVQTNCVSIFQASLLTPLCRLADTMSAIRMTHLPSGAEIGYNVSGSASDGEVRPASDIVALQSS